MLILGYSANLLAFIFIGRVTFLYHYLISLVFAVLILSLVLDRVLLTPREIEEKPYKIRKLAGQGKLVNREGALGFKSKTHLSFYFLFLSAVLAAFIFLAPISYGLPISQGRNSIYQQLVSRLH